MSRFSPSASSVTRRAHPVAAAPPPARRAGGGRPTPRSTAPPHPRCERPTAGMGRPVPRRARPAPSTLAGYRMAAHVRAGASRRRRTTPDNTTRQEPLTPRVLCRHDKRVTPARATIEVSAWSSASQSVVSGLQGLRPGHVPSRAGIGEQSLRQPGHKPFADGLRRAGHEMTRSREDDQLALSGQG